MELIPSNRNMLVAFCDDPRQQGIIIVPGDQQEIGYGVVMAVDEISRKIDAMNRTPEVNAILAGAAPNVGDIVYFNACEKVIVDNNATRLLVHESFVKAIVRGVEAKIDDRTLTTDRTNRDNGHGTIITVPKRLPVLAR